MGLSEKKNFPITEGVTVQFRADLFNILNHPNFANPDGSICSAINATNPPTTPSFTCATNQNFGGVGQTIADVNKSQIGNGSARQAQFLPEGHFLKLRFPGHDGEEALSSNPLRNAPSLWLITHSLPSM